MLTGKMRVISVALNNGVLAPAPAGGIVAPADQYTVTFAPVLEEGSPFAPQQSQTTLLVKDASGFEVGTVYPIQIG